MKVINRNLHLILIGQITQPAKCMILKFRAVESYESGHLLKTWYILKLFFFTSNGNRYTARKKKKILNLSPLQYSIKIFPGEGSRVGMWSFSDVSGNKLSPRNARKSFTFCRGCLLEKMLHWREKPFAISTNQQAL